MSPTDPYQRRRAFKPPSLGRQEAGKPVSNPPGKVALGIKARLFALCLIALVLGSCKPTSSSIPLDSQPHPPTETSPPPPASETSPPSTPTSTLTHTTTYTATSSPTHTPTSPPTHTPTITSTPTIGLPSEAISWELAHEHAGEQAIVCGPVVDGVYAEGSRGKPTFLNLGLPFPEAGRFTVLIWGDDRLLFPEPPEVLYFGKMICVNGQIEIYRGTAEIIVEQPEQIQVP